ncbi:hypothetical protein SAMN04487894_108132 [Niabella drilacis]|uniref:Uncharacterized protein n=1 Tax=Niabella drilacis (strain DSM 25811 / CCM 8410 / CCUG 62505 / LMG 26954 / E90) TaxID=1285928 RepID=A0A1G6U3F1_NIADE|nr:hypothetical protein SAMN04487894_108132 [Niabella drilacis]
MATVFFMSGLQSFPGNVPDKIEPQSVPGVGYPFTLNNYNTNT